MGNFSTKVARNVRYKATAQRESLPVSCVAYWRDWLWQSFSLPAAKEHRSGRISPHHETVPNNQILKVAKRETFSHVDEVALALSRSDSPFRNDSNDGSCIQLKSSYPDLTYGGVYAIKRKRFAVVTYSDVLGSKTGHYCKVRANHCAYAELVGDADCTDNRNLEMCVDPIALQSFHLSHPAAWAKVSLLHHCCRHFEYVLLLDVDLIVMDAEKYPLERFVREAGAKNKFLTFTGTGVEKTPINSGLLGSRCAIASSLEIKDAPTVGEECLSKTLENSRSMPWRMNELWEQRTMRKLCLENQKYRNGILLVLPERETQCFPKSGDCSADDISVHILGDKSRYET